MSSNAGTDDRPLSADESDEGDSQQGMLGPYRLERPLGSGGMGTVYLAFDPRNGKHVALKVLARDKAANPGLAKRFHSEAKAAARLNHENIVPVYDSGKANGYLYIVFEYVAGTDVAQLLKQRGRLPMRRTLEIVKQVARALDHAFRQGIVHRDIKPSNMLIKRNGTVKLADMGLARSVDESTDTGLTREGTTVGTVDYMAPEQAQDSKSADVRSDIYSLGCAWYHMLTGSPPFPTGSVTNKLLAHIAKKRPDPRDLNPEVPEQVAKIVLKMMARERKERYQTPAELLDVLERISFLPDAMANRFLSALDDVVAPRAATTERGSSSAVAVPRRRGRAARRGGTRRRRARDADDFLLEALRNVGLVLAGLIAATVVWWIVMGLFAPAAG